MQPPMMPSTARSALRRPGPFARAALAVALVATLAACSGGTDASDVGAGTRTSPLVQNDAYPNVAADPARNAKTPKTASEVRRIEDRMMSLANEQGNASRASASSESMVEQMKALARKNRDRASGVDAATDDTGTLPAPTN